MSFIISGNGLMGNGGSPWSMPLVTVSTNASFKAMRDLDGGGDCQTAQIAAACVNLRNVIDVRRVQVAICSL